MLNPRRRFTHDSIGPLAVFLPESCRGFKGRQPGGFSFGGDLELKKCNVCLSDVRFTKDFVMDRDHGDQIEVCKACYGKLCDISISLRVDAGFIALDLLRHKSASVHNDTLGRIAIRAEKE